MLVEHFSMNSRNQFQIVTNRYFKELFDVIVIRCLERVILKSSLSSKKMLFFSINVSLCCYLFTLVNVG